jgi:hypothetical protein
MLRAIGELTPKSRDKLEETLSRVAENFGNPRQHAGLGLRKLGPAIWECRLDLSRRIILIQDEEALLAYDIMDHDALRAWLRS